MKSSRSVRYRARRERPRGRLIHAAISLLLLLPLAAPAAGTEEGVADIGSRRELFVDPFIIEALDGARLELHEPLREGIALKFDQPWEGIFSGYITVLKDGETYRMYYRGRPEAGGDGTPVEVTCYAESNNGNFWTKPPLRLFEIAGSLENNVIMVEAPFCHNFCPFLDTRPGVPESERFKALAGTGTSGLFGFVSADGIHWSKYQDKPLLTEGAFDSQNVAFWSAAEGAYVCYFRTWKEVDGQKYRWISRTTSANFIDWEAPVEMTFGDTLPEHLYTNGTQPYFRAPHIYIGLAKRFFPGKVALPPDEAASLVENPSYRAASSDSVFMTSRGGSRYDRTFMEAFIRPGPSPRDWICRDNTPALGVVEANPREMYLYRLSHYAQPSCHVMCYSLRLDGFVSVHAPYQGGELITKPFIFTGDTLEINHATSAAGSIRVEIQDAGGKPVHGFRLEDCLEIFGDQVARSVAWRRGGDLDGFAGETIRLRFFMKDADLYSFRFR